MKKFTIIHIAVNLFGLYFFYLAIMAFIQIVSIITYFLLVSDYLGSSGNYFIITVSAIHFIIMLVAALFFVFRTSTITNWICQPRERDDESLVVSGDKKTLLEAGIILLGFAIIVITIPAFLAPAYVSVNDQLSSTSLPMGRPVLGMLLLRLVLGVSIIYFNNKLAQYLLNIGQKKVDE